MIVNVIVPFAGVACSLYLFPSGFWLSRIDPARLRARIAVIFHLSKWIFLSSIVCTVIMRLDIYLLENLSTQGEVGQYSFALNLSQGIMLISSALATVLLPKLSVTRARGPMIGRCAPCSSRSRGSCLRWPASPRSWHLGARSSSKVVHAQRVVFDMLAVSFAVAAVVSPISFFCLAFDRARWLTWM